MVVTPELVLLAIKVSKPPAPPLYVRPRAPVRVPAIWLAAWVELTTKLLKSLAPPVSVNLPDPALMVSVLAALLTNTAAPALPLPPPMV